MAINGKPRKIDYSDWSKPNLINEIKKFEKRKKYGLVWDEERTKEIFEEEVQKKLPVLKDVTKNEIKDKSKTNNILIEGDNYHALSVLNYTHKGKIDVIYIDPPYNLGKEFVYNDKLVDKEDSYKHSKWLSFMKKRLNLAKNCLSKRGVIFISIDDNEQAQLRLLCNEIFGEGNFIDMIIIESNPRGAQASKHLANVHEYVLVYAKSESQCKIDGFTKDNMTVLKNYPKIDKEGKRYRFLGLRQRGGEWRREQRKNMFYPLYVNPDDFSISLVPTHNHTKEVLPKRPSGEDGRWTWAPKKAQEHLHLLCGKKISRKGDGDFYDVFRINRLEDEEGNISLSKPKTIWTDKKINYQNGRTDLKEIFAGKDIFDYPKPTYLIKKILSMFERKDLIILDFFAGSGTTGHAVLNINEEDGGNRKFILCTNNENNICTDVCYPRIKKVIKGYKNSKGEKIKGLEGSLKYFKTSFVDSESTDQNKKIIVQQSTEMLCLKEDCFKLVKQGKQFKIFKNSEDKYLGIIYYYDGINQFKKEILKLDKPISTYVFSFNDIVDEKDFVSTSHLVNLKPIPSAILNVYKRIFAYV